jgi:hypothetical protein
MDGKIDREQFVEELQLRECIRKAIKVVSERKEKEKKLQLLEEVELRNHIRKLIEVEVSNTPHESTAINRLRILLKKIIPIVEEGYKSLTSDREQRNSYRAHIIKGVQNLLAPVRASETHDGELGVPAEIDEADDVEIEVGDPEGSAIDGGSKFIDVRGTTQKSEEELEKDEFSITGEDATGRNVAIEDFKKIETSIIQEYSLLENEEDEQVFYDFTITNLKLHFDAFEEELLSELPEPSTPEYEKEKQAISSFGKEAPASLEEQILFNIKTLKTLAEV